MAGRQTYSMAMVVMILVAFMVIFGGSVGTTPFHGRTDFDVSTPCITIDNALVALYVNTDSLAWQSSYIPRARGQLYQNDNRNAILRFIEENPGSKLFDIANKMNANLGTVRYHVMILCLNHVIVPYNDGARQVRYFINNGTYTPEEMQAISLMSREPISKLVNALAGSPGLTNSKITAASGLSYSEVNRYLKELVDKGAVLKESLWQNKYEYRLAPYLEDFVKK
jgi:predicted transcriptional regulator